MKKIICSFFLIGLGMIFAQDSSDKYQKGSEAPFKAYYPNSDYIEPHYPNASEEQKEKLIKKYYQADQKSGLFLGITAGYGSLYNNYNDGLYNRTSTTVADLQSQTTGVLKSPLKTYSNLIMFGGKLGYQAFFNPYFGARIYGDAMLSTGNILDSDTKNKIGTLVYMLGAMNADLLVDFPLDKRKKYFIGAFVGVGIGVMILLDNADKNAIKSLMKDQNYSSPNVLWNTLLQVDYTFNAGLSFTLNRKNKIELGAKIPWNFLRLGLESPATYTNSIDETQKTLVSKDIEFSRSIIWNVNYIYLF